MTDSPGEGLWQSRVVRSRLPWKRDPIRPAEVSDGLLAALLDRTNLLEDVKYQKIVPNHYDVELSESNYLRNYKPIERQILQQWREALFERLMVANSRQGRREYRFAGRLQLRIRAVNDLHDNQARILCRVSPDDSSAESLEEATPACLLWIDGDRRWRLRPELATIGRDAQCDICLDIPTVQERRLVSGLHAYIRHESGEFYIFDGEPGGKPSMNGTFVNGQPVPSSGLRLREGDTIILASIDPLNPRADTPGAAALSFHPVCP